MSKTLLTNDEQYLFAEGTYLRAFDKLGAHPAEIDGKEGYNFGIWVPDVKSVRVVGSFNDWNTEDYFLHDDGNGVFSGFIEGIKEGELYKFVIETKEGELIYKADPYAFYAEVKPATASVTIDIEGYDWKDKRWMNLRQKHNHTTKPLNIYEVHLGSWRCHEDGSYYTYDEMSKELVDYVKEMGYTHVEIMPVMEHPFDGSWGYQITGYFAPTSRYGTPKEFMHLVESFHKAGIGVIIDWVPGHFCKDAHGLGRLNGDKVYESKEHAQWGTYNFDFSKGEVRSFLISNALYWIEKYHVDGIRVDGVSSILYMNFGIDDESQKKYNLDGTEGDLDAIDFVQNMNKTIGTMYPDVMLIAEESTAWPLVTRPPEVGGLGFHYKWDMGWMNDTLNYFRTDFPFKPYNHNLITFSMMYTYNENFILPLSHDEVVHGKASIIGKMPGDYWRQFAGLRVLALYQMTHPGGKLNFMGSEFGQFIEWRYYEQLEWFLIDEYDTHKKQLHYIKTLNDFYLKTKSLWIKDSSWEGYTWIDADDNERSIISFIRHGNRPIDDLIVIINFTPETYNNFMVGVPKAGDYVEIFNSDSEEFGGSGVVNTRRVKSKKKECNGMENSIKIKLPPIGGVVLKRATAKKSARKTNTTTKSKKAAKAEKTTKTK
ncbi:1,4-alpha-glucan branching protein GlgB [Anaerofustis butyriciformans]|uniref:1,4-alpha-glucan branching protein GlgB n=1 Tax=Anaerofustis butyriciformans TaxID=3108533 RepID=UPI003F8B66D8